MELIGGFMADASREASQALEEVVRRLADEAAIRRVLTDLADAGDRLDLDRALDAYHPDATEEHGAVFVGSARDFLRWGMAPDRPGAAVAIEHCLSNFRIEVNGDRAASQTYVLAGLVRREDDGSEVVVWFGGRYLDHFERREGAWRISHRRLLLDWETSVARQHAYELDMYRMGVRSRDDASYELFAAVAEGRPWPANNTAAGPEARPER